MDQGINISFETIKEKITSVLDLWGLSEDEESDLFILYSKLTNWSALEKFLVTPDLTEVLLHSYSYIQVDTFSSHGLLNYEISFENEEDLQLSIEVFAFKNSQSWNSLDPFKSFYSIIFKRSFRVTLIHGSLCSNGSPKIFFRRTKEEFLSIDSFTNTIDQKKWLEEKIRKKSNIIISGATGSGKTTLMNSFIHNINIEEHLILLEDVHEFPGKDPHISCLLSGKKTLVDYCPYALRMRPDRIMIGELRGAEIIPFFLSMNTGHKGMLTTLHANSASDSIERLGTLFALYSKSKDLPYEKVFSLICQNLDYIIFMEEKRIVEVIKILGADGNRSIFQKVPEFNLLEDGAFQAIPDLHLGGP